MSRHEKALELLGEFKKTESILDGIRKFYEEFRSKELPALGQGRISGIVMAEIFVDYYTCVETLFFRLSQVFENHLSRDRWHSDLLHKMTLDVESIRPAVIRDETAVLLDELMKFRHFKRYYFQFDYDWDRLLYLDKKWNDVLRFLGEDFGRFKDFLTGLSR
ncbi:MAG: hypothetical protein A2487_16670 [Candidatus Raymondbacteria bacterium RifOxyC12_full_50_8]|nr:MAG: hypothetical protein A2350_13765 [Candidatus Raymondbacteria bacterium RifOxyB12_full_50_8]OGJ94416.1 MAG: hypothetical protein A2487_16670 [Candidatus Raymondbacteria bacterium RifOxyC12_full_50_8]